MAEDLTAYTEVNDPYDRLSKTESRVTLHLMDQKDNTYLYKDFGSSHFDTICLMFAGRISSISTNYGSCSVGFSNVLGDASGWSNSLRVDLIRNPPGTYSAWIVGSTDDYYSISADTTYYFTLERTAGSASLKIYSNSARTSLLATLTCTCSTNKWRYLYPAASYYTNDAFDQFSGYFEDFLLINIGTSGGAQIIGLGL